VRSFVHTPGMDTRSAISPRGQIALFEIIAATGTDFPDDGKIHNPDGAEDKNGNLLP